MVALISEKMPDVIVNKLENLGYGCVLLPDHPDLDAPVASHADMLFSVVLDGLLTDGEYLSRYPQLAELGLPIRISQRSLGKKYPLDIAFDALIFNGIVYGNTDFIAPEILQSYKKAVFVKQGYTLCSTLITNRVAITADDGIYRALAENGVSVLKISASGITLDGYSCGFIGGASVYEPLSNTVIFFGDVTKHPDFNAISDFLCENGHRLLWFDEFELKDLGGAKLINIK